jgi:hypothetical protein
MVHRRPASISPTCRHHKHALDETLRPQTSPPRKGNLVADITAAGGTKWLDLIKAAGALDSVS